MWLKVWEDTQPYDKHGLNSIAHYMKTNELMSEFLEA